MARASRSTATCPSPRYPHGGLESRRAAATPVLFIQPLHFRFRVMCVDNEFLDRDAEVDWHLLISVGLVGRTRFFPPRLRLSLADSAE